MSVITVAAAAALITPQVLLCLHATGACLIGAEAYAIASKIADIKEQSEVTPEKAELLLEELKKCSEKVLSEECVTKIANREVLIKTIEENGTFSIQEKDGKIICKNKASELEFYKKDVRGPYYVKIYIARGQKFSFDEIDEQYGLNVQDINYNNIIRRIKEEKLEIKNEEITENNTIVLTVNLG